MNVAETENEKIDQCYYKKIKALSQALPPKTAPPPKALPLRRLQRLPERFQEEALNENR